MRDMLLPLMEREVRLGSTGSGKRQDVGGRGFCQKFAGPIA